MNLIEKFRGKRRWKWTGYSLFFSMTFYAALFLTFPYDALRDRVTEVVRERTGKQVTIGKVRLAGLTGIRLHDVRLLGEESESGVAAKAAAARQEKADLGKEPEGASPEEAQDLEELRKKIFEMRKNEGDSEELRKLEMDLAQRRKGLRESAKKSMKGGGEESEKAGGDEKAAEIAEAPAPPDGIHLDSLTAKVDLFSAIRGRQGVSFDARAWGGRIEGKLSIGEDSRRIAIRAKGIVLEQSPILAVAGLDLEGKLETLELELAAEGADFSAAAGQLVIKGDSLVLRGGEVQHFELPRIVLGTLDGKVDVRDGKADTDTFEIRGADLDAKLAATVRLAPELASSTLSGKLQLKPSDDWWNRNEMLKTAANFAMPASSDGWRSLNLHGQLRRPGFRP